jgi:hypothetical protein
MNVNLIDISYLALFVPANLHSSLKGSFVVLKLTLNISFVKIGVFFLRKRKAMKKEKSITTKLRIKKSNS